MENAIINQPMQAVVFTVDKEEYAIEIRYVQEIKKMTTITRVPKASFFVEGVINLRGNVLPVIDLRKRLSLKLKEADDETRIIIIKVGENAVGIIVDSVAEVINLQPENIEPPPPFITGVDSNYLQGVGKVGERLIILLDVTKILT